MKKVQEKSKEVPVEEKDYSNVKWEGLIFSGWGPPEVVLLTNRACQNFMDSKRSNDLVHRAVHRVGVRFDATAGNCCKVV